jgi:hypothetical protein
LRENCQIINSKNCSKANFKIIKSLKKPFDGRINWFYFLGFRNRGFVVSSVEKNFRSIWAVFCLPVTPGCVPSDWKSDGIHVRPSLLGILPFAHK